MNRGDARLLVVVLATAVVSSAATALITQRLTATSAVDERLQRLEERTTVLELLREVSAVGDRREPGPAPPAQPPLVLTPVAHPPDAAACDEVSCVLNDYTPACCARYGHPSTPPPDGVPESLDRAQISNGIAKIKAQVVSCGDKYPNAKGKVSVSVKVGPDGTIARTTINDTPDPALAACVQQAVSGATFAKTRDGGAFRVPFVF